MAKLFITLFALVVLAAVAFASPMGIGMGVGHGMVSSHHSSHIGMGHHGMMGYPGIGMVGHGMTMGSVHKSYHHGGVGMYPGMIMG